MGKNDTLETQKSIDVSNLHIQYNTEILNRQYHFYLKIFANN